MFTNFRIERKLAALKRQPARDPQKAAEGRARFLAEAAGLAEKWTPAVSLPPQERHTGWMVIPSWLRSQNRKERSPMFGVVSTIALVFSLIFGGGGIMVAAAQESMPDDGLYAVKTWSEAVQVRFTASEQARLSLALSLAARRGEEIQAMLQQGKQPPAALQAKMQEQFDYALRLAAGQPDEQAARSLEQIRARLQEQEQAFRRLQDETGPAGSALLEQVRAMLQMRLQICEDGIANPDALRQHIQDRDRTQGGSQGDQGANAGQPGGGSPWNDETVPPPAGGSGPGPADGSGDGTPSGGASNPWTTGTPTPGSGYGPGPGDGGGENQPAPTDGYGPGPGDGSGDGTPSGNSNPNPTTPTPGSGYGPGDGSGDCTQCTPTGDGYGPGPQPEPTQVGPGGPGAGTGEPGKGN